MIKRGMTNDEKREVFPLAGHCTRAVEYGCPNHAQGRTKARTGGGASYRERGRICGGRGTGTGGHAAGASASAPR